MKNSTTIILTCLGLLLTCLIDDATAVIVVIDNGRTEVRGYEVSRSKSILVVDQVKTDGSRERRSFSLTDPDVQVLDAINIADLEQLDPSNPRAYLDLASRLEAKVIDPEVHDLVVRLFLIAAYLDTENLSVQSFRYLAFRGRTVDETNRFKAILRSIDKSGNPVTAQNNSKRTAQFLFVADQIAQIRIGRPANLNPAAMEFLAASIKNSGVRISLSDITERTKPGVKQVSFESEIALVAFEGWLRQQATSEEKILTKKSDWATLLSTRNIFPARSYTIEGATEFNPAHCVYSNGQWVVPAK
tara:strand:- start:2283 stop:3188 length:906 start_codon:yes stop_codon:yes gene_type:complete